MEDLKIFGVIFGIMLTVMTVVIAIFMFLINIFMANQCSDFTKQTGRETKYNFLNGCLVHTDQGWIAGENLIVNLPTK